MKQFMSFVVLAGAAALVACASQPPAPAASAHQAVAPATATAPGTGLVAQTQKFVVPAGYRRETQNGQIVYCHTDEPTGSRIRNQQTCYTQAQLQSQQNDAQQYLQNSIQHGANCSGAFGTGGNNVCQ